MSVDLEFEKADVKSDAKVYAVKHIAGPSIAEVNSDDTITFTRSGLDDTLGFKVTFIGESAPSPIDVPEGQDSASLTAPKTKKTLTWKYVVSFDDSSKGDTVVDLDPIIIINPGLSSSLTKMVVSFAAGAVVAYGALTLFPGLGMG